MKHNKFLLLGIILSLVFSGMACSIFSASGEPTVVPETPEAPPNTAAPTVPAAQPETQQTTPQIQQSSGFDTEFPLPDDVREFTKQYDGQINFQTGMSLQEIEEFYREQFTSQGLREKPLLTIINEKALSMVFEGSVNGKMVVVQSVVLDLETRNVNIRYE